MTTQENWEAIAEKWAADWCMKRTTDAAYSVEDAILAAIAESHEPIPPWSFVDLARKICHAVENRSDDFNIHLHARILSVLQYELAESHEQEKGGDATCPTDIESTASVTTATCSEMKAAK